MIDWPTTTQQFGITQATAKTTTDRVIVVCNNCSTVRVMKYAKAKYSSTHHCKSCTSKLAMADPQIRASVSNSLTRKHQDPEYRAKMLALLEQPGRRAKISADTTAAMADPAIRVKISKAVTTRMQDNGVRQHLSTVLQHTLANPTTRAKMSLAAQAALADPVVRAKISDASQAMWQDPAYRAQHALTTTEFINRARVTHGQTYDYSKTVYVNQNSGLTVTCPRHGDFSTTPQCHLNGCGCPSCALSSGQLELLEFIRHIVPNEAIVCNDRTVIHPYELDIYLPNRALAWEFNGNYWHSFDRTETMLERGYHQRKTNAAAAAGVQLMHIAEYQWIRHRQLMESMIKHKLGLSTRCHARSLTIRTISDNECADFMTIAHLQGHKPATVAYGLLQCERLISAMSFTRYNDRWEIERYATIPGMAVIGGASKLFTHFVREQQPQLVHTYADRAISDASVYLKLGFKHIGHTQPGYLYLDPMARPILRIKCQKHKLPALLGDDFDPALTEAENMFKAGYRRMWNAGNHKLIWQRPA